MKIFTLAFSGGGFDLRYHDAFDAAGQHRAADDDCVLGVLGTQRFTDFARDMFHVREIGLPAPFARCADANE